MSFTVELKDKQSYEGKTMANIPAAEKYLLNIQAEGACSVGCFLSI
ncbi:hypothetical protein [Alkalihalobacillus sp. TS-13]|nr:hypothetical protein [Alkalihalobacillus sp. TS-13]